MTVELLDASLHVIGRRPPAADGTFTFSGRHRRRRRLHRPHQRHVRRPHRPHYGTTSYAMARQRAESNLVASDRPRAPAPSYGFRPTRSIGDTVFNDLDGDGVQDAGEAGIAGVVVEPVP